jgi:psiF repeat/Closterovirus coat protein
MARRSCYAWGAVMLLLVAVSPSLTTSTASPQKSSTAQSTISNQDKAKARNDLADKKGLKDSERKTFMQNCLKKAANSGTSNNVSQQDNITACKNIADKKGLSGADRRSFLKDCMNKANPR